MDFDQRIAQAYVIGGSPCSGKTTIAGMLSTKYNLHHYQVDQYDQEHLARVQPGKHPVMYRFNQMSWDEIWMRPVDEQVREEFAYYEERFELIQQDISQLGSQQELILEGAALIPGIIHRYPVSTHKAVFIIPTYEFQRHYYEQRPFIKIILDTCEDPETAFNNWMMRDHLFGKEILRQAESFGFPTIVVDGTRTIGQQLQEVSFYFGI